MGLCYYLVNEERGEAYYLGKGPWSQFCERIGGRYSERWRLVSLTAQALVEDGYDTEHAERIAREVAPLLPAELRDDCSDYGPRADGKVVKFVGSVYDQCGQVGRCLNRWE